MTNITEELESDLKWREAELVSLKILAAETVTGTVRQRALLRACLVLLYAHYEGFCKYAWDLFLDHIVDCKVIYGECTQPILTLALSDRLSKIKSNATNADLVKFFTDELPVILENPVIFSTKLSTRSNLWPNLFKENAQMLGLMCTEMEKYSIDIKSLVGRRNDIAHGKAVGITTINEYTIYEERALLVMHDLAVQLCDAVFNRTYLLKPPV